MKSKECLFCGDSFTVTDPRKKYCDNDCGERFRLARRHAREQLVNAKGEAKCRLCGGDAGRYKNGRAKDYCQACKRFARSGSVIKSNCPNCKKPTRTRPGRVGFCSHNCKTSTLHSLNGLTKNHIKGCVACHCLIGFGLNLSAKIIGTTTATISNVRKDGGVTPDFPNGVSWYLLARRKAGKSAMDTDDRKSARAARRKNPSGLIYEACTKRMRNACRAKGSIKLATSIELIGCSWDQLAYHLSSKFSWWMDWDNYGDRWAIDHIMPCDSFDLSTIESQRQCFHFSNLQPLSNKENRLKGARITDSQFRLTI